MISKKKDLIDLDLTIKFSARRAKNTVNQWANVTQWSNYLVPQWAESLDNSTITFHDIQRLNRLRIL